MAIAQGIFQSVRYGKQSALGTPAPDGSGQQLPRTTFDMNLVKNTFQSNRIVEHQQASGTRHGTQRAEGSYNDEVSCGTHKDLWAALLRGPWTPGVTGSSPGALWVPQSGHTDDIFTFEGWRSDVSESRLYPDTKVVQAQISVQPNGMATVNFSLMGRDMTVDDSQHFTSPAAAVGNIPASGAVGEISVDGTAIAVVTAANITINGNGSVGDVIGSKLTPDVFRGIINVSGDFSLYHQDKAILQKYLDEATISLAIKLDEPGGDEYFKISMPLVTVTSYTMQDAAGAVVAQCQFNADMNEAGADAKAKSIVLIEDTRVAASVAPSSVDVTPATATVEVADTVQLSASVAPSGASQAVTWTSSDPEVASVDANGLVTGEDEGTATITATSDADPLLSDTATITVTE